MKSILIPAICVLALTPLSAYSAEADEAPASLYGTHKAMGTEFSVTVFARDKNENPALLMILLDEIFEEIDRIEAMITTWDPDSQVSYVNRHAAENPVRVSVDVIKLLQQTALYSEQTAGAFDATVGPLSRLYGLYENRVRQPADAEIRHALAKVGMKYVEIEPVERRVSFARPGIELDFGGIGKGFAVDRVVEILRRHNVTRALVNGGSSTVFALGAPVGKRGWTVRIRHPYNPDDALAEVVLTDESLSTSGCYDLDEVDGVPICNIFDPRTGQPRHGMLSATVIAPNATQTDALSTGFLVMGIEETRAFCAAHPDVRAVMVPESPDENPAPVWIGEASSPSKHGSTP